MRVTCEAHLLEHTRGKLKLETCELSQREQRGIHNLTRTSNALCEEANATHRPVPQQRIISVVSSVYTHILTIPCLQPQGIHPYICMYLMMLNSRVLRSTLRN